MIHELLAPHGIIFVSINDIELFRLGMLPSFSAPRETEPTRNT